MEVSFENARRSPIDFHCSHNIFVLASKLFMILKLNDIPCICQPRMHKGNIMPFVLNSPTVVFWKPASTVNPCPLVPTRTVTSSKRTAAQRAVLVSPAPARPYTLPPMIARLRRLGRVRTTSSISRAAATSRLSASRDSSCARRSLTSPASPKTSVSPAYCPSSPTPRRRARTITSFRLHLSGDGCGYRKVLIQPARGRANSFRSELPSA